ADPGLRLAHEAPSAQCRAARLPEQQPYAVLRGAARLLPGAAGFPQEAPGPLMADNLTADGLKSGGMAATGLLANGFRVWNDRKPDATYEIKVNGHKVVAYSYGAGDEVIFGLNGGPGIPCD